MERENIYYHILSRGESVPETFPEIGQTYTLRVKRLRSIKTHEDFGTDPEDAILNVEFVNQLGHYARVRGPVTIGEVHFPVGAARFETGQSLPLDLPIGELKVQTA